MPTPPTYIPPPVLASTDATPAERQTGTPQPGEATGSQADATGGLLGSWGWSMANGGCDANPCGFPWYGSLYLGSYRTYDWMLEHPIIQHAHSQVVEPIIASPWGYEGRDGTSAERVQFVKDQLDRLRFGLVSDSVRALHYGWMAGEKIWEVVGGQYFLEDVKPLAVYCNGVLADKSGKFAGIAPEGTQSKDEWLGVNKTFHFANDAKFRSLFGRPRLENLRATAWRDWLDAATQLMRLSDKISGIMPVVYTPAGTFKDLATGEQKSWAANALTAMRAAKRGEALHLTHMGAGNVTAGTANYEQLLGLIKASAVRLDVIDFGDNAPAIAGLLDRMRHDEELMFAGYFQSPRTGMATQGGTKADAQQHTDTATVSAENLAASIAGAVNRQIVDEILTLNFGPEAKGSVWVTPGKLTDANLAIDTMILKAVLDNQDGLGTDYLEQLDVDSITDRRGIPHEMPIVLEAVESDPNEPPIDDPNPSDPNAPPQPPQKPKAKG